MAGKKRAMSQEISDSMETKPIKKNKVSHTMVPSVSQTFDWTNKQRVLVFSQRGISFSSKHLMKDLLRLLPHSRTEVKLDRKSNISEVKELCEMRNCNKCIFFQENRKKDLYMWISNIPNGPSIKFQVSSVYTMKELKLTGNSLLGSRPLLSFSSNFESNSSSSISTKGHGNEAHGTPWALVREMFVQIFGTPLGHPKSKPFVDHIIQFTEIDGRVWVRNYQIADESRGDVCEIGPRLTLYPVVILESSFSGQAIYHNPHFVSPTRARLEKRINEGLVKKIRSKEKTIRKISRKITAKKLDDLEDVFN